MREDGSAVAYYTINIYSFVTQKLKKEELAYNHSVTKQQQGHQDFDKAEGLVSTRMGLFFNNDWLTVDYSTY